MARSKAEGRKERRSTIYDVARRAGVSAGTVSHVLNGTAPISAETRSRVMDSVRELGYSRNENARALRTADSKLIGVVLDISSEYYSQCTASILQHAQEMGYAVVITDAFFSQKVLKAGISALVSRRVNGLIFVGGAHDRESYEIASAAGVPIVFGDRYVEDYPCVQFNNHDTVYRLVHALYRQGYREFCYYGEKLSAQQNLEQRFGGFRDAVRDLGVPEENYRVILQENMDSGKMKKAFDYFYRGPMKSRPGGGHPVILTSNDMIAQGVISAVKRAGLSVPEDMAVFGFDNISITAYATPSISTVMQDPWLLGEKCFELLQQRMRDPQGRVNNVMLEQKIVLRESTRLEPARVLEAGLNLFDAEQF